MRLGATLDINGGSRRGSNRFRAHLHRYETIAHAGVATAVLPLLLLVAACSKPPTADRDEISSVNARASRAPMSPRRTDKNSLLPSYVVRPLAAGDRVKLDGKLDEPFWRTTAQTQPFVHPGTGEAMPDTAPLGGTARLRYDAERLYIAIIASDTDVHGGFSKDARDPHLWTKDTVEIMLDPEGDGDNRDYYEIQVNPQGLVFDSRFDDYNRPRVLPEGPFGHEDWSAELERAVTIQGTLDEESDVDEGYVVELALPFRALSKAQAPREGTVWRANFYVMQNNGGVSWSPILGQGNFHKASRFGRLEFVR